MGVDAYNNERVLKFNERNKFKYLYSTEEEEMNELHVDDEEMYTRLMFLDLIHTEILECPEQYRNM